MEILTDHKALEGAMSRDLTPDLSNRVFRLLEEALSCNISIKWVRGAGNMLADSLSRTPTGEADAPHYPRFSEDHLGQGEVKSVVCRIRQGQIVDPLLIKVAVAAKEDIDYQEVVQAISGGHELAGLGEAHPARQYRHVYQKLTVYKMREGAILLMDSARVVIPSVLREETLKCLHVQHPPADAMIKTAMRYLYWPDFAKDIEQKYKGCLVCQENRRMQYPPVKLQIQDVLDIHIMDRIQCDWGQKETRNFHVIVDHASIYLWAKEFRSKTTENSLSHIKQVINQCGRPLECITDRGPSYRDAFQEGLKALGVGCSHGASYNPRSQSVAEKAVGRLKQAIEKNPIRTPSDLEELVSGLNWVASSEVGAGSAADRFYGRTVRGLLPAAPGEMSPEAHQLMMDTMRKNRARIAKKFKNSCDTSYTLGQRVMVWNRKDKQYSDLGTVVDMEEGDDGLCRSFIVDLDHGTEVHLLGNHLLPVPEAEEAGQVMENGAV